MMKKESRLPLLEQPLVKKAADFYAERAKEFTKPRNEVYLASSATAIPKNSSQFSVWEKIREISLANIGGLLKKECNGKTFFLPEHIPNFSGFDDLILQMLYISGFPLDRMERLEREILESKVDIKTLNNYQNNWVASKFEHEKMLKVFMKVLGTAEEPLNPVSAIVLLPDYPNSEDSLNGKIETQLAEYLKIPLKEMRFNNEHPNFKKLVVDKIVNPQETPAPNLPTIYIRNGPLVILRNFDSGPIWRIKKAP